VGGQADRAVHRGDGWASWGAAGLWPRDSQAYASPNPSFRTPCTNWGLVPERPAEEWTGLVIDITDTHGERLYWEWTYEEIAAASDRARAEANAPVVVTYNEPLATDRPEHETGE
jgi:hypothetical protein